ncbi:hypothetical protein J6590_038058 [Homalodisca vitripennis]|nr:hypothetical protein J6590_038058 [Homalodisca vitripennis]
MVVTVKIGWRVQMLIYHAVSPLQMLTCLLDDNCSDCDNSLEDPDDDIPCRHDCDNRLEGPDADIPCRHSVTNVVLSLRQQW